MFQLETERLLIRPWHEPEDRPHFTALTNDPEVTRYIHHGQPFTTEEIDDFFARQEKGLAQNGLCMGALIEKASGSLIGISGIQPLGTTGDLEVGWILSPSAWGKGYATEAGAANIRHVLETLGRKRVVAIIDLENEASKRVAARLGMEYEGRYTGTQLGHRRPEIVVDLYRLER